MHIFWDGNWTWANCWEKHANFKYDVWHLQRVHEKSGTNHVDFLTSKSSNSEHRVCFIFDDLRFSSQSLFSPSHGVGYQHQSQQSQSEVVDRVSPSNREIPCFQVLTCLTWWMTESCLWVTSALLICYGLRGLWYYRRKHRRLFLTSPRPRLLQHEAQSLTV